MLRPNPPTPALVRHYIDLFDKDNKMVESAISQLVKAFPNNTQIEHVLLKVVAINALYNTNIYATSKVAEGIVRLGVDTKFATQSMDVVDEIANIQIGPKKKRLYSFATKYSSWHAQQVYPIFDRYVEQLLWDYVQADHFIEIGPNDLRDYRRFRETILAFQKRYELEQFTLKDLDMFLWQYGIEWDQQRPKRSTATRATGGSS